MDEISIREKFKIDDSHSKIRGIVCAYDENNNLVFEKENMIVKTGRQYIMKHGITDTSFVGGFISDNASMVTEGDILDPSGITRVTATVKFDASLNLDVDSDTVDSITNSIENFETFKIDSESNVFIKDRTTAELKLEDVNYFSYSIDRENLVIRCLLVFNDDTPIKANSLGLIYNNFQITADSSKNVQKEYYTFDTDTGKFVKFLGDSFQSNITYFENHPGLFSRVTFPTYFKSNHQRLTFKYYIYF